MMATVVGGLNGFLLFVDTGVFPTSQRGANYLNSSNIVFNVVLSMTSTLKLGIGFIVFSIGSEVAWQLWKKYFRKNGTSNNGKINEALIFNFESAYCREHAMRQAVCDIPHCPGRNIKKLVNFFDSVKETLDVCIYILTYKDISDAIIRAHRRGINIRLIVDSGMSETSSCSTQLSRMRRAGIKIRMHRSTVSLMHHKFAIRDEKLMILGSSNWTMQAFFGNYDASLITNEPELVRVFSTEFNRMWSTMDVTDLPSPT
ncbi:mitochondrial cardiolipin hydrolase [Diachasmimorpha longicaudata]|uniref:mitochondrial cardiolipin hydrolase n=1 Tax=Diachasmimorpha longicaudata TaxID=58733 RepID=UPI0030B86D09